MTDRRIDDDTTAPRATDSGIEPGTTLRAGSEDRMAVAVVAVEHQPQLGPGGWVRFRLRHSTGGILAHFVETLALSAWDVRQTGLGAYRTLTMPVAAGNSLEFQAFRGDVKVIRFHFIGG
jgi:hypothetical protein